MLAEANNVPLCIYVYAIVLFYSLCEMERIILFEIIANNFYFSKLNIFVFKLN